MARGMTVTAAVVGRRVRATARGALTGPRATALLLFAGAAAVRLAVASQLVFPPLGDAAYYIAVAQSLYAGRGLTIGNIWNYQPAPATVVGPSNAYWGPLPSLVEWLSLVVFGNSLFAALLPDVLAGALLVALTYLAGRRVFAFWLVTAGDGSDASSWAVHGSQAHWLALGAALLLAVDAELVYQSASGDSTMLYGVMGFAAILLWDAALAAPPGPGVMDWRRREWGWRGATVAAWVTGILLGCAYLTRGAALFLFAALAGWWCWHALRALRRSDVARLWMLFGTAAAALLGTALVLLPWLVRQQVVFGHALASEATSNALAFSLDDFFDYGAAPTLATYLQHGWSALLALRLDALGDIQRHVNDYAFYPTSLLAIVGLCVLARRLALARLGLLNLALLMLGFALIFPAVSLFGGYYHSLASVAPMLAWGEMALFAVVARWARARLPLHLSLAPAFAAMVILLQVALLAFAIPVVTATASSNRKTMLDATHWLVAHHATVVMATESTSLYYASGIPTIELPAAQSPAVAYACAVRYGAGYLVIFRPAGLYPRALDAHPAPHFVLVERTSEYAIYQVVR